MKRTWNVYTPGPVVPMAGTLAAVKARVEDSLTRNRPRGYTVAWEQAEVDGRVRHYASVYNTRGRRVRGCGACVV